MIKTSTKDKISKISTSRLPDFSVCRNLRWKLISDRFDHFSTDNNSIDYTNQGNNNIIKVWNDNIKSCLQS